MSNTVITSTGNSLESIFVRRFGRAVWFCIHDDSDGVTTFIENKSGEYGHGAGTCSAELMVEHGISRIISGDFGPKAKDIPEKFNIQLILFEDENISIAEILNKMGVKINTTNQ